MNTAPPLSDEHPWPGLESYDEDSRDFFYGRSREADALVRQVTQAPLTLLYGKSGLGKSSLLKAGLFPLLRARHFLPVWVRLDLSTATAAPLIDQMTTALLQEFDRVGAECPPLPEGGSLWEYLHPREPGFWSADNFPLTPVLVFDQFEELFVRGAGSPQRVQQVFDDLGDLIENRIPPALSDASANDRRRRLDLLSQHYRVVLSFREDFMPELKSWERRLPSLMRHFLRLEPLSSTNATSAVHCAGQAVIEDGVAPYIVNFVGRQDGAADSASGEPVTIEPVLLSLCCSELNRRRKPEQKIDRALVDEAGKDILDSFYREALADEKVRGEPDAAAFIEEFLVQGDTFRGDYPVAQAIKEGRLTQAQIECLTDKHRLLRIVQQVDAARIELIHDRLVPVVSAARDKRRQAAQQRAQRQLADQARQDLENEQARAAALMRERNRFKAISRLAVGLAIAVVVVSGFWLRNSERMRHTEASAKKMQLIADLGLTTSHLVEQRMAVKSDSDATEEMALRALASYRLSDDAKSQAWSLIGLHKFIDGHRYLRRIVKLPGLDPTPALSFSPDGKLVAVGGMDGLVRLLDADTLREARPPLDCGVTTNAVWTLAFNEDGQRLAAGFAPSVAGITPVGRVCVFDLAHGGKPQTHEIVDAGRQAASVYMVSFGQGPDGEIVASGGSDQQVHVWHLATGREETYLAEKKSEVVAVMLSRDHRHLAVGSDDGALWLLDLAATPPVPRRSASTTPRIQHLAFSPADPSVLFSTGDDGRVKIWNLSGPVPRLAERGAIDAALRNRRVGGVRHDCRGWRRRHGAPHAAGQDGLPGARQGPRQSRGSGAGVRCDGRCVLFGHGQQTYAVAFNPAGDRLMSTGSDGSLRLWGPKTDGFSLAQLDLAPPAGAGASGISVTAVAIRPDGHQIAAGDSDGQLHLWAPPKPSDEPSRLGTESTWAAHHGAVRGLTYVKTGEGWSLASAGEDGLLQRWNSLDNKAAGPALKPAPGPGATAPGIVALARSPDAKLLATGSSDGAVRVWSMADGVLLRTIRRPEKLAPKDTITALGFSSDGRYLALAADNRQGSFKHTFLIALDPAGEPVERLDGHRETVTGFAQAGASQHWLMSVAKDGQLLTWPNRAVEGSRFERRMSAPLGARLTAVDVSADGRFVVTGGERGLVQLWDVSKDGLLIGSQFDAGIADEVSALAIAPGGEFFVVATGSKLLVWPGPPLWADLTCAKLSRNMSQGEWEQWVSPSTPYLQQCPGNPNEIAPAMAAQR